MQLGKKLYKTTQISQLRWILFFVVCFLFFNLYQSTFSDHQFQKLGFSSFSDVWSFHFLYPEEAIIFVFIVLCPFFYYSFIRGTNFYENGISLNRGLPYFNHTIWFKNVESFRIIHPKHLVAIQRKKGDELLILSSEIEMIIAILDQQGIKGNLKESEYAKALSTQKYFLAFIFLISIVILLLQRFGIFKLLR